MELDVTLNGLGEATLEKKLFVEKHCERVEGEKLMKPREIGGVFHTETAWFDWWLRFLSS
jgi:hypothetical protein